MKDELEFHIKFIKEIEKHPCLYDPYNEEYTNKRVVEDTWAQVGEIFDETGSDCKMKWRTIRSSYVRSINTKSKTKYYLSPYLQFLHPFLKCRSHREVFMVAEDEDSDALDVPMDVKVEPETEGSEDEGPVSPERKLSRESETVVEARKKRTLPEPESQEHCRRYLLSLIPHLTTMTERQQLRFKKGVIQLIEDIKYSDDASKEKS